MGVPGGGGHFGTGHFVTTPTILTTKNLEVIRRSEESRKQAGTRVRHSSSSERGQSQIRMTEVRDLTMNEISYLLDRKLGTHVESRSRGFFFL